MDETNRAPKKNNNWLYYLLAIIVVGGLIIYFSRSNDSNQHVTEAAASDSSTVESHINSNWSGVDPNIPQANYDELKDSDLQVRANEDYAVYSLNEQILFEEGKSAVGSSGAEKLDKIATSAEKRFAGGSIIVYGYTDSIGSKEENQKLALARANAVKMWLTENKQIDANRITVNAEGERSPISSNTTAEGRKDNRRVDIVVRKK